MRKFLLTRLLQALFTLWVVSLAVFFSARLTGSPELAMLPMDALPEQRQAFRQAYGLDQPVLVQYWRWISRAVQGEPGKGIQHKMAVSALLPVVTFVGFMFGIIIASSITTETVFVWPGLGRLVFTVFVWPGLGRLVFEALMARDFPVIQGVVLVWSAIMIFLNLCVDLTYGLIDPRIRLMRS